MVNHFFNEPHRDMISNNINVHGSFQLVLAPNLNIGVFDYFFMENF